MGRCLYPYGHGVELSCQRSFLHRLVPFRMHYAERPGCKSWWTTKSANQAKGA